MMTFVDDDQIESVAPSIETAHEGRDHRDLDGSFRLHRAGRYDAVPNAMEIERSDNLGDELDAMH
jgi:hypothetical protein